MKKIVEDKPAKGQSCTVCRHPEIEKINELMIKARPYTSYRQLAEQFGLSKTAYGRHSRRCLQRSVANLLDQQKVRQAIDVVQEFEDNLAFTKRLRLAVEKVLADPEDPTSLRVTALGLKPAETRAVRKFALEVVDRADRCIDKFAKLRGLYQRERENEKTFHAALDSYNLWLSLNPDATDQQKADAVAIIARGGQVSERELAHRAGVPLVSEMLQ